MLVVVLIIMLLLIVLLLLGPADTFHVPHIVPLVWLQLVFI